MADFKRFSLSDKFIQKYVRKKAPFGFNGLGELVYKRTYSRVKADGTNEEWYETVCRVVEGTYNMQKKHIERYDLGWNAWQAQRSAQEMYDRIFNMKFLPPGRGLWAMGSPITEDRHLFAALNNCAFVSTLNLKDDLSKPFCFLMDASMLGVGVGFDTKGSGQFIIKGPNHDRSTDEYNIPDTREGWVESVKRLLESYFLGIAPVSFDYKKIRAEGAIIKGFGGVSSGYEPLKELHKQISGTLDENIGNPISITTIVDIMNLIGKCVVAGNVRRTAEIVFGDPVSDEYINLKNYQENPHRKEYGWTSNNSVFAELGMNYKDICSRVNDNGEPGFAWLENMQAYSRIINGKDWKDHRAVGGNPCLEQTLESYELCCLVETFPANHKTLDDYLTTLKYAYLYAKTVTLGKTHWPETNRVMLRNRRIGCSVSGIAQFIGQRGIHILRNWLKEGYGVIQEHDKKYSDWLAIPRSIKTTSVKPSGTVSLLAGATPGLHYPESRFYIRRMRLSKHSELVAPLEKAGYKIEQAFGSENSTVVVEVPVDVGENVRTLKEVSMWEQLSLASFMQRHWADNQVSCTVTFDPTNKVSSYIATLTSGDKITIAANSIKDTKVKLSSMLNKDVEVADITKNEVLAEGDHLPFALDYFQYQLKGISFLPRISLGAYPQMPYEEISSTKYNNMTTKLKKLNFKNIRGEEAEIDKFCTTDVCELKFETEKQLETVNNQ